MVFVERKVNLGRPLVPQPTNIFEAHANIVNSCLEIKEICDFKVQSCINEDCAPIYGFLKYD